VHLSGLRRRRTAAGACAAALVAALALTACSDSAVDPNEGSAGSAGPGSQAASRYATPLKGICPDTVTVQTGWWPEVSMGFTFQLLGPNPTVDEKRNRVTGPLGGTGVTLDIRAGGPAVGFQPVSAVLAAHDDILFGYVGTDEAVQLSGKQPTVAVFAPYEKTPLAFLWGEQSWNFADVAAVGRSGETVLGSENSAFLDVFTREGLLNAARVDATYQGGPDRFVAADGKIVQEGFVTNEPYRLEHDVPEWGKPVKYLLLADEFPIYQAALSVRQDKRTAESDCLSKLVPLFQQAQRDYVNDPGPTNKLLLKAVDTLDTGGFGLSAGLLEEGNRKQRELGLIADGRDGALGSFDADRVRKLIDRLTPVFTTRGSAPKPGLAPRDVVTNEFLDTSISLR
jgi:hypothetical protein